MTEIPQQRGLAEVIADIELLKHELAEYLELYFDMINDFETPQYINNPKGINLCFPNGLEDDQLEIISLILKTLREGTDLDEFRKILEELKNSLSAKVVTSWAMKPIFKIFLGYKPTPKKSQSEGTEPQKPESENAENIHIKVPNLHYDRDQLKKFYRACGLKEISIEGKGSHTKWVDEKDNTLDVLSHSKKLWLKNIIKHLISLGYAKSKIIKACKLTKIEFEVIKL